MTIDRKTIIIGILLLIIIFVGVVNRCSSGREAKLAVQKSVLESTLEAKKQTEIKLQTEIKTLNVEIATLKADRKKLGETNTNTLKEIDRLNRLNSVANSQAPKLTNTKDSLSYYQAAFNRVNAISNKQGIAIVELQEINSNLDQTVFKLGEALSKSVEEGKLKDERLAIADHKITGLEKDVKRERLNKTFWKISAIVLGAGLVAESLNVF